MLVKAVREDEEEVMREDLSRTRGGIGNDNGAGESYPMDDIQSVSSRRVFFCFGLVDRS